MILKRENHQEDITRYQPEISIGLSNEQVQSRKKEGFYNKTKKHPTKTYWQIFCDNVFSFFNILLILIAIVQITVQIIYKVNAISIFFSNTFLGILLINMGIGVFQDIRAKRLVEKLRFKSAPVASVIREGKEEVIQVDEVVLDDVMLLKSGNNICSDAVVKEGCIEVNESMLTGESISVRKKEGDVVYSGTFVVSGSAVVQVEHVGKENYMEKLTRKAKQFRRPKSELLRSLNRILKYISYIIVPLGVLSFCVSRFIQDSSWLDAVEHTAGSMVGMIPSGMFLLTSMTLAVGTLRLGKKHTMVQELYCIEMLARTDVICFDKTGTLTDGTMKVQDVVSFQKENTPMEDVISSILFATKDENQTAIALEHRFARKEVFVAKSVLPFSSERKYSAASFDCGTYFMGAPEFVIKKEKQPENVRKLTEEYQQKGLRTLLLAKGEGPLEGKISDQKVEPIALIVIQDHIRENARDTIRWFKENGVDIRIISGDHPMTVSEIARQCEVDGFEKYIDLEGKSLEETKALAEDYIIFGRVSPEQKAVLVEALREKGHTVAMTGDGVNDILALKNADCSIAMFSGSEATRNVSHLVLTNSDFSSMPEVVFEGRRAINNLQNTCSLFLVKTIFAILTTIGFMLTGLFVDGISTAYPFVTKNLMVWEVGSEGVAAFFLALQPNKKRLEGSFVSNVISRALPGGICVAIAIALAFISSNFGWWDAGSMEGMNQIAVSMSVVLMSYMGFVVLFRQCLPFNAYRTVLFSTLLVLSVLAICISVSLFENGILEESLFGIYPSMMNLACWMTTIVIAIVSTALYFVLDYYNGKWIRKGKTYGNH